MEPVNAVIKYYEKSFQVLACALRAPAAACRLALCVFKRSRYSVRVLGIHTLKFELPYSRSRKVGA
jgi:hypothetical protein